MKTKGIARKTVFLLNDDDQMLEILFKLCRSLNVRVVTSQCVVEAVKLAEKLAATGTEVLAFVDLMVPLSLSDLYALRKALEGRRRAVQRCLVAGADREQRLREAREEIDAFDLQTRDLIDAEGGLTFLRESSRWIQEWRIVIMSVASNEFISKSREAGIEVWQVLSVPFPRDDFEAVVAEFLDDMG